MNKLFIIRWPCNLADIYVNGSDIKYLRNGSVYYANEVLSPGQTICVWRSHKHYLKEGIAPTLPLLEVGRSYYISTGVKTNGEMSLQMEISFYDRYQNKLKTTRSTEQEFAIEVPEGTTNYEIRLVNLKNRWLQFDYLTISDQKLGETIQLMQLNKHYSFVETKTKTGIGVSGEASFIVSLSPMNPLNLVIDDNKRKRVVHILTDGKHIAEMLDCLQKIYHITNTVIGSYSLIAGQNFNRLPIKQIKEIKAAILVMEK